MAGVEESGVTEQYKINVRRCPIEVRKGAGSDNYQEIVFVDWRPVLHPDEPDFPLAGCEFELGFDPTLDPPAWADSDIRYAPAPVWARSEAYIQFLEKQVGGSAEPKSKKA